MANPRIIDRYFSWTLWGAFSRRRLLVTGDIADQDTDAVVTAAHWRLNKGAGTDGTIHTKGGPKIYEECRKIGGCPDWGRGNHDRWQSQGPPRHSCS